MPAFSCPYFSLLHCHTYPLPTPGVHVICFPSHYCGLTICGKPAPALDYSSPLPEDITPTMLFCLFLWSSFRLLNPSHQHRDILLISSTLKTNLLDPHVFPGASPFLCFPFYQNSLKGCLCVQYPFVLLSMPVNLFSQPHHIAKSSGQFLIILFDPSCPSSFLKELYFSFTKPLTLGPPPSLDILFQILCSFLLMNLTSIRVSLSLVFSLPSTPFWWVVSSNFMALNDICGGFSNSFQARISLLCSILDILTWIPINASTIYNDVITTPKNYWIAYP